MIKDYESNIGKFIISFDERYRVLEIKSVQIQSGITWYSCEYEDKESTRSRKVDDELKDYAIIETLQEANKIASMTIRQLIIGNL